MGFPLWATSGVLTGKSTGFLRGLAFWDHLWYIMNCQDDCMRKTTSFRSSAVRPPLGIASFITILCILTTGASLSLAERPLQDTNQGHALTAGIPWINGEASRSSTEGIECALSDNSSELCFFGVVSRHHVFPILASSGSRSSRFHLRI